ncbi:Uncharacterised protein [Bordetella pertussis]|nr:Uncharacterised protein [Bordetella pertussis]
MLAAEKPQNLRVGRRSQRGPGVAAHSFMRRRPRAIESTRRERTNLGQIRV